VSGADRLDPAAVERLIADVDDAERELAGKSEPFRSLRKRGRAGLSQILQARPPRSALVSYVRYRRLVPGSARDGAPAYAAFVTGAARQTPVYVDLGSADRIDSLVEDWRREAAPRDPWSVAGQEESCRRAGAALRQAIWDPVARALGESALVFVVPDGTLHHVNPAALPGPGGGYLIEDGPTLHLLSAERDLLPHEDRLGQGLLAVGRPDFDRAASAVLADGAAAAYRGPTASCADFDTLRFEPLPRSIVEVGEIGALWARGANGGMTDVVTLVDAEASEAAVKRLVSGRRVIHVATHAFFLGEACARAAPAGNPLLVAGLALAGANRRSEALPGEEDGILTAEEIASLDLTGVECVVLSACESGLGEVRGAEGLFGMRRAFQIAGARTLITSLWRVQDETARQWMQRFYEIRERGATTAEAARRASLDLLESRRRRGLDTHPSSWGAFVAVGDPR
jgi:CHAT domain-containing protein